jgi:hypothetical protein
VRRRSRRRASAGRHDPRRPDRSTRDPMIRFSDRSRRSE